ncbi:MAG TPA: energy transducer TonB [Ferruginibacter sp.]|nr:energy transducer TonB [Ferruginibacter sp.]
MKKNELLKRWYILVPIVTIISCNMGEDKTDTTTTTDTSSVMVVDSSRMATDMATTPVMDTASSMTTNKMSAGTAKPNPAKKGMKGKVMVTPSPVAKATANMEMDNTGVYDNVEYIPSFPGGSKGLQSYFDKNLVYPDEATNEGVEGTVNVTFVVDENGKLSSPQVNGNKLGYGLEEEAIRVVSKMPVWTPGKLKGQNVKTRYTLPITFQLY